ncbi:MAG: D-alanyl-D-alanine dipeptidase [Gammaproteobacteria bacterium]|jgi:D-alanyl-D-alanine dipeptidase|nr:D-alanyl-D-alanine dipeptidase [Gammaproteobacteria bacterium]
MIKWMLIGLVIITTNAMAENRIVENRPTDFVNAQQVIPQLQTDIRYASEHNFVGRKIKGYEEPVCVLTQQAANALKTVETQLLARGLTLKAYDCYRPHTAVNDFIQWASEANNVAMRAEFYPTINKAELFKKGYIAYQSGHSRGSSIDLTIVPVNSQIPAYNPTAKRAACTATQQERFSDNSLDFGTGYDCFSPMSHPDYPYLPAEARKNRALLRALMRQAGFKPLYTEWWHFTLINEPYPNTYFDFPVEN